MYRRMFLVLLVLTAFVFSASAQNNYKKYDVKSGIVTYEEVIKISGMTMNNKYVLYFDDFGAKECRETWNNNKLNGVIFCDGKDKISLNPSKKKATRVETCSSGVEIRADWTQFGTEKDKQSGKIKILPGRTIAGKPCDVFQAGGGKDETNIYAGYKKVLMLMDIKSKSMHTVRTAVKFEENVPVSADKFKIPAGYSL